MNNAQKKALIGLTQMFQHEVERSNSYSLSERTHKAVTFSVRENEYHTWVSVDVTHPNAQGTFLSALGDESWFIKVGKRGALTAHCYPRSVEQFAGRKFLCINIARDAA